MPPNVRLTLNRQLLQTENWAIIGQIGQYWGNNWALCVKSGGQKTNFGGQKRWSDKLP